MIRNQAEATYFPYFVDGLERVHRKPVLFSKAYRKTLDEQNIIQGVWDKVSEPKGGDRGTKNKQKVPRKVGSIFKPRRIGDQNVFLVFWLLCPYQLS